MDIKRWENTYICQNGHSLNMTLQPYLLSWTTTDVMKCLLLRVHYHGNCLSFSISSCSSRLSIVINSKTINEDPFESGSQLQLARQQHTQNSKTLFSIIGSIMCNGKNHMVTRSEICRNRTRCYSLLGSNILKTPKPFLHHWIDNVICMPTMD